MKKLKLLAINKDENRCQFTFEKNQEFFEFMRRFLPKLDMLDEEALEFGKIWNPQDHLYENKEKNIKKQIDMVNHFSNKEYFVEIIFGKDKIFLIIISKEDKQQFISKILEEFIED